jgi:hypothetical protein
MSGVIEGNRTGWWFPTNSRKAHFFNDSITSLCGKWMCLGSNPHLEPDDKPSKDDCAACRKKLDKLKAAN